MNLIMKGKVKDVYEIDDDTLLFRFSNRISVFDKVIPSEIPKKGEVLNRLSAFWFKKAEEMGIKTHFIKISSPEEMLVKRVRRESKYKKKYQIPLEFICRHYVAGSLYDRIKDNKMDYRLLGFKSKPFYGEKLPSPMIEITTKFEKHDRLLSEAEAMELSGLTNDEMSEIKEIVLKIDAFVDECVRSAELIHVDGKKEFGFDDGGRIMLIDTFGTPDEDRFWDLNFYWRGECIELSKEFVRQYYRSIGYYHILMKSRERCEEEPDIPPLPDEMIKECSRVYVRLYEKITGDDI